VEHACEIAEDFLLKKGLLAPLASGKGSWKM
jgi:hypothetical protein